MSWSAAACKCCTAMCSCSVKATPQCPQPPHSALLAAHRAGSPEVLLSARAASGMLKRSAYEKTEDFRKYFHLITENDVVFCLTVERKPHFQCPYASCATQGAPSSLCAGSVLAWKGTLSSVAAAGCLAVAQCSITPHGNCQTSTAGSGWWHCMRPASGPAALGARAGRQVDAGAAPQGAQPVERVILWVHIYTSFPP